MSVKEVYIFPKRYRKISLIADAMAKRYTAMSEIAMCELDFNTKSPKWGKLFSKDQFLAIFTCPA